MSGVSFLMGVSLVIMHFRLGFPLINQWALGHDELETPDTQNGPAAAAKAPVSGRTSPSRLWPRPGRSSVAWTGKIWPFYNGLYVYLCLSHVNGNPWNFKGNFQVIHHQYLDDKADLISGNIWIRNMNILRPSWYLKILNPCGQWVATSINGKSRFGTLRVEDHLGMEVPQFCWSTPCCQGCR